jgi:predicted alpha/beta hydrolase
LRVVKRGAINTSGRRAFRCATRGQYRAALGRGNAAALVCEPALLEAPDDVVVQRFSGQAFSLSAADALRLNATVVLGFHACLSWRQTRKLNKHNGGGR